MKLRNSSDEWSVDLPVSHLFNDWIYGLMDKWPETVMPLASADEGIKLTVIWNIAPLTTMKNMMGKYLVRLPMSREASQPHTYHQNTMSIPWLLMPWLLALPGHQWTWHGIHKFCMFFSLLKVDFKYPYHFFFLTNYTECKSIFIFPHNNSTYERVNSRM